jgi:hypothetical protein
MKNHNPLLMAIKADLFSVMMILDDVIDEGVSDYSKEELQSAKTIIDNLLKQIKNEEDKNTD